MQTFGLRASGASPQNPHRSACVAIYHCSVKTVSRSTGRSAPAAAAYRTGTLLVNERDGVTHDYRRRAGVEAAFIVAPDGAGWAQDRAALWNAAEAAENRKNSTVAREYEVALPAELSAEQRADLAHAFAAALVERYGVAADVALHAPGGEGDQRNHHAHVLTTTRTVGGGGLGPKTRALDDQRSGEIERVRELWAGLTNAALERAGVGERVSHLSHAARGLEQAPTAHLGPSATALERRGVATDLGDTNRAVEAHRTAQEAVAGNEALLSHLEKAEAVQQVQRPDPLARYREAVEAAEQRHDGWEMADAKGQLDKAAELVGAGERLGHHGDKIKKAGETAAKAWARNQARQDEAARAAAAQQIEQRALTAWTASQRQAEAADAAFQAARRTFFAGQERALADRCEQLKAEKALDLAERQRNAAHGAFDAWKTKHPFLHWISEKTGMIWAGQEECLDQVRASEGSLRTAKNALAEAVRRYETGSGAALAVAERDFSEAGKVREAAISSSAKAKAAYEASLTPETIKLLEERQVEERAKAQKHMPRGGLRR